MSNSIKLTNPVIVVDQASNQVDIFNGSTRVCSFSAYTDREAAVEAAKLWVKARTTVEPIMQYPRITKVTFRS